MITHHLISFQVSAIAKFVVRDGKTFMVDGDDVVDFGDFTLKLLGELKHSPAQAATEVNVEEYWVVSCGVMAKNAKIESRFVPLLGTLFLI